MGLRDLPFWGSVAAEVADQGLDRLGARRCARRGHKWRAVSAFVEREDGSVIELPRGAAERCQRCGATRQAGAE